MYVQIALQGEEDERWRKRGVPGIGILKLELVAPCSVSKS